MADAKDLNETPLSGGKVEQTYKIPEPRVTGTEQIKVLGHSLINKEGREAGAGRGVSIDLQNLTGSYIGKVIFKVVFYDDKGILDTIEPIMTDFEKDKGRTIYIKSSKAVESDVKSYDVKIEKIFLPPVPEATGSDAIKIMKHSLQKPENSNNPKETPQTTIEVAIRNVSDKTLATIVLEAVFYDAEGEVLDTLRHRELEMQSKHSRAIFISSKKVTPGTAKSYKISVIKTITTDVEKVQLYSHGVRVADNGGEEVRGRLKNISDVKTDAALVAVFSDHLKEKIGTIVIPVMGIEPGGYKEFHFIFNTPKGEFVGSYTLSIGEMTDEYGSDKPESFGFNDHEKCGHCH